jgi:hypothetical protein
MNDHEAKTVRATRSPFSLPLGEESFLPELGGNLMQASVWYRGESLTRLMQGVAVGVVATLVVGFGWGGWMLGSSARTLADGRANSAVAAAIAPICVEQFQRSADAAANLSALKKASAWEQATFVEKGGWAVMPGSKTVDDGVPQACAALLTSLK